MGRRLTAVLSLLLPVVASAVAPEDFAVTRFGPDASGRLVAEVPFEDGQIGFVQNVT